MTGPVLVTGGSGFVGAWCIVKLIEAGYRVRTTVRSLAREDEVRVMLRQAGCEAGERLSFVEADLMSDAGWRDAAVGCEYVLHVASPLPIAQPTNEDELIVPAREGALRVVRAWRPAGLRAGPRGYRRASCRTGRSASRPCSARRQGWRRRPSSAAARMQAAPRRGACLVGRRDRRRTLSSRPPKA